MSEFCSRAKGTLARAIQGQLRPTVAALLTVLCTAGDPLVKKYAAKAINELLLDDYWEDIGSASQAQLKKEILAALETEMDVHVRIAICSVAVGVAAAIFEDPDLIGFC